MDRDNQRFASATNCKITLFCNVIMYYPHGNTCARADTGAAMRRGKPYKFSFPKGSHSGSKIEQVRTNYGGTIKSLGSGIRTSAGQTSCGEQGTDFYGFN
jgi:hypothetical protein